MRSTEISNDSTSSGQEDGNYQASNPDNTLHGGIKEVYDHAFIKSNFCPIKLNRSDIKNLSSDFTDQSLGGHREYREELIDGRLAKVYVYTIKIIKYENDVLEIHKQLKDSGYAPTIIVENNMIVPFNMDIVQTKQLSVNNSPVISAYEPVSSGKRGRPRKYPKGEEPYKAKKRMANTVFEDIPESRVPTPFAGSPLYTRRPVDPKSLFTFDSDMSSQGRPQQPSFFEPQRQTFEPPAHCKNRNAQLDDFLSDFLHANPEEKDKKKNVGRYDNNIANEYF